MSKYEKFSRKKFSVLTEKQNNDKVERKKSNM